jgi:hypothetical protein
MGPLATRPVDREGAKMSRLSETQVQQFKDEGWLAPFRADSASQAGEFRRRIEGFEEQTGLSAEGSFKIKGHLASPWMVDLACHPAILDVVEDLIGPNILLLRSSIFAKNARDAGYVSWHQDSLYYGQSPLLSLTAWVAFTPSNRTNGCLRVIPGTHRNGNLEHEERKTPQNLLARGHTVKELDDSNAVDLELDAGEFSIHYESCVHGSEPNTSGDRRIGMAFFYAPTHVQSLKGRRAAVLVRGQDEYGYWEPEVLPRYDQDPLTIGALADTWKRFSNAEFKA